MTIIRGQVVDPRGQPVAEATVYIVSSPVSMPDIAQLTDEQGHFTIAAPIPGHYRVGVQSDEWGSVQIEVDLGDEEPPVIEVHFDLTKG
jgi:protocatechuate 3,4-dioxygenase beta subunit